LILLLDILLPASILFPLTGLRVSAALLNLT
jgi:hypothetical protein